jgi:hypothetical protein
MATLHERGDTQILILNRDRFPTLEDRLWHSQLSQQLIGPGYGSLSGN